MVFGVSAGSQAAPPKLERLFPPGAARGTSVVVTASGEFPQWPAKLWASHPEITAVEEMEKGKFKISVGPNVPPGRHWLRCFDKEGASSLRPFVIGSLPESEEKESNNSPDSAQPTELPKTINGRLARQGDVDSYRMTLRAGQMLVASIDAHTELGSPMDAVVQLCWLRDVPSATAATHSVSSANAERAVEAFVLEQIDDTAGLDPRLAYSITKDGDYLIRVFAFPEEPNSTIGFAGGDSFVYRLTLTTGGFVDHAMPVAVTRDSTKVQLFGWNVPNDNSTVDAQLLDERSAVAFHPECALYARIAVVDSGGPAPQPVDGPLKLELPAMVTGRLQKAGERPKYSWKGVKGSSVRVRVESRALGFEMDPMVSIVDSSGKQVAEDDDSRNNRDPDLTYKVPEDGEYTIQVEDAYGHAGFRFVYQLSVVMVRPDFGLTLAADSFVVAAGKSLEIPVKVTRLDGFDESIDIKVEGLPAGLTAAAVTSPKGTDSAKIVLNADAAVAGESSGTFRIIGTSTGAMPLTHPATYTVEKPNTRRSDVWLTVTSAAGR